MNILFAALLTALCGYLLGSISFAVIVSKTMFGQDVRDYGSGNAGMTNILRVYGKKPAAFTLVGDFLKGAVAVLLGRMIYGWFGVVGSDGAHLAGLCALLGHLYPLYFGFRGGKGILTAVGIIAVIDPLVFLGLLLIGLPLMFLTRIVSVGSIVGAACYPFLTLLVDYFTGGISWLNFVFAFIMAALVIWMHRANIKRLINGTENRFGSRKTNNEEKK